MTTADRTPMFPALSLMEKRAAPTYRGHLAYLRAPLPDPAKGHTYVPSWNWTGIHAQDASTDETVTLDVNGSYMAALGAVDIAFSELRRMGPLDSIQLDPRYIAPGYYRITTPGWALDASIVSPLGGDAAGFVGKPVWIAHPTLQLLLELMHDQYLGYVEILDSWTSGQKVNFRAWNVLLKQARNAVLDAVETAHDGPGPQGCKCEPCARYRAFKEGYGAAFSMMRTGQSCKTRRPDWADAVYAQHAAARWRNAWRFLTYGPVLYMGSTDELTVRAADLERAVNALRPPLRLDPSGRTLGTYKVKPKNETAPEPAEQPAAIASASLPLFLSEEDNIL